MSKNDDGRREDEKGVRNPHAKSTLHESNVISLDKWIKEEREEIIRRAKAEDGETDGRELIDEHESPYAEEYEEEVPQEHSLRGEIIPLRRDEENEPFFVSEEDEEKSRKKHRRRKGKKDKHHAIEHDDGGVIDDDAENDAPHGEESDYVDEEYEDDELPPEELSPEDEEKLRRRKKTVRAIGFAVALLLVVAGAVLAYFLLIVDSIDINGNETYSDEQILTASGLHVGTHIWINDVDAAKRQIESDPYIKEALITRVYPDKIAIKITERHEFAVIISLSTNAVIDEEGYVLEIGHRSAYDGLLTVYGTGSGGYHVNQRLGEESSFSSRTLTAMLSAIIATGLADEIESVDLSNPLSIYMMTKEGLKVQVGQPEDAEEKLLKMCTVMDKLRAMDYAKSGTLDLSAKGDPVYSPANSAISTTIVGSVLTDPNATIDPNATHNPDGTPNTTVTPEPNATPNPDGTSAPSATNDPGNTETPSPTGGEDEPTPSPTQYFTGEPGFSG